MKANPKVYEINTAVWLYELSCNYGESLNLGNVPSEQWDKLEKLGFDYVWLMGVWKRSKAGPELFKAEPEYRNFKDHLDAILPGWTDDDVPGSPYSIASYEPDTIIGAWVDLGKARDELRMRDMGLILDFVPNHTAPDHPWVHDHPHYYIQGSDSDYSINQTLFTQVVIGEETHTIARGKDPYFPPWTDTVQLNYFNPLTRAAVIQELGRIVHYCDGIRCDMAMLVLNDIFYRNWSWLQRDNVFSVPQDEFWAEVRRSFPDLLLIAEAYWDTEWRLQKLGFDYVYDKRLYDRIRYSSPQDILLHLKGDIDYQKKLLRFIENHDEPRSAEIFPMNKLRASAALFSTLPGMRLFHQGQLEGRRIKIPVQIRRVMEETPDREIGAFYEKLLAITGDNVFSSGEWRLLDVNRAGDESFINLVSYTWRLNGLMSIIVINLSGENAQGRVRFPVDDSAGRDIIFHDEWDGQSYIRNGNELLHGGLYVLLEGYGMHIFKVTGK